jgi:imidazolonepropionase-like amidohydrolase
MARLARRLIRIAVAVPLASPAGWALFALLFLTAVPLPGQAGTTALIGATVIDGSGRPPLADAILLIVDGRIAALAPRASLAIPAAAKRVEVGGKWIIPGLIDAHIHFFQSGGLYTRPDIVDLRAARPYEEEVSRIKARLRSTLARYLASGVTAVADVGGPMWNFEVRRLARSARLAPRVAVAGPLLATHAPAALATSDPAIVRIDSPEAARAEVRRQLAYRPDLIKIWLVYPKRDPAVDLAWARAAIDEAHGAGLRVAVHATERRVAEAVIAGGADILVHSVEDRPLDDALLARMKAQNVIYTPTLLVGPRYSEVFARHVPFAGIERRLGDPRAIASLGDLDTLPREMVPRRRPARPVNLRAGRNLRRAAAAGITIAAGSDAGNIGTLHGPSLHRELELMAAAGLTPMQVIVAATRGGAAVMGRSADLGTLAPGKLADLVILDADPLADIRNTRRIHRVVKGGEFFDPAEIMEPVREN